MCSLNTYAFLFYIDKNNYNWLWGDLLAWHYAYGVAYKLLYLVYLVGRFPIISVRVS